LSQQTFVIFLSEPINSNL